MLTQSYLKECLHYNPETGVFTWLKRPLSHFNLLRAGKTWNTRFAGKTAGSKLIVPATSDHYLKIGIGDKEYLASRLAWFYMHNEWPEIIDHEDGNKLNNAISNLRNTTRQGNQQNLKRGIDNKSGQCGVCKDKRSGKWRAYINVNGKQIDLGLHKYIDSAIAARKDAELTHGFHPNHGR
tara:strand:- start:131 stop:670 length:540 start_codon:yes stop_codon:yes gene_type:complete